MADVQVEQNRAFGGVIDIFEATGIEYVIWGGVAVVTYGEPRFTRDMDVVVRLRYSEADTLARLLEETGYSVSVEAIRDAVDRYFYFNAIHLETGIKVDFYVAPRDPIYAWAFKHRRMKNFDEFRQAAYMPPESVILTKLAFLAQSIISATDCSSPLLTLALAISILSTFISSSKILAIVNFS